MSKAICKSTIHTARPEGRGNQFLIKYLIFFVTLNLTLNAESIKIRYNLAKLSFIPRNISVYTNDIQGVVKQSNSKHTIIHWSSREYPFYTASVLTNTQLNDIYCYLGRIEPAGYFSNGNPCWVALTPGTPYFNRDSTFAGYIVRTVEWDSTWFDSDNYFKLVSIKDFARANNDLSYAKKCPGKMLKEWGRTNYWVTCRKDEKVPTLYPEAPINTPLKHPVTFYQKWYKDVVRMPGLIDGKFEDIQPGDVIRQQEGPFYLEIEAKRYSDADPIWGQGYSASVKYVNLGVYTNTFSGVYDTNKFYLRFPDGQRRPDLESIVANNFQRQFKGERINWTNVWKNTK
jgi:hypothetical protein